MSFNDETSPQMASDPASPSPPPLSVPLDEQLIRVTNELREQASDYLELAALETRFAVSTALSAVVIAVCTAILLVSAWMALVGAAALGLIGVGLPPVFAMLLVAAVNLLLAAMSWLRIRQKLRSVGWPAMQGLAKPPSAAEATNEDT